MTNGLEKYKPKDLQETYLAFCDVRLTAVRSVAFVANVVPRLVHVVHSHVSDWIQA